MTKQIYTAHNALLPGRLCNRIMKTVLNPNTQVSKFSKPIDFAGHREEGYAISPRDWNYRIRDNAITINMMNDPTGKRISPVYTDIYVQESRVLSVDIRHPFIQKLIKTCDARIMEMGRIGTPRDGITPEQMAAAIYLESACR